MTRDVFASLSQQESIHVPKTNGKRGWKVEGVREELTDINGNKTYRIFANKREIEKKRNRWKNVVWEEKSFNWKGVNFEGIPSRAEPSVTYSQLSRSYFCLTFPICKFRAAFTSNQPFPLLDISLCLFLAIPSLEFYISLSLSPRSNLLVSAFLASIN